MKQTILSCEAYGKKLTLELPRDSSGEDLIDAFNLILSFKTFTHTVQELVEEDVLYKYHQENKKEGNDDEE